MQEFGFPTCEERGELVPQVVSIHDFGCLIAVGKILPGDMINVVSGEPGFVGWAIERTQRKLLRDLHDDMPRSYAALLARYTHTAVIIDLGHIAELFRPHARTRTMDELFVPGETTLVQIRRPVFLKDGDEALSRGIRITDFAKIDVAAKRPYPTKELFIHYGMRWNLQKLWLGRKFGEVFTSKEQDVCSGSYWRWCLDAGAIATEGLSRSDRRPEAWYPARLACDKTHFETIGVFSVERPSPHEPVEKHWRSWAQDEQPPTGPQPLTGPFTPTIRKETP